MRSMLLLGFVVAGAAGCESTRHSTVKCVPCKTHKTSCPATPATPAPSAASGQPVSLPPTIKEVRGEEPEPRQYTSAPATTTSFVPPPAPMPANLATPPVVTQGDVVLIPRWVYVPYSSHSPNGPAKLPANIDGGAYVQSENGISMLPHMDAAMTAQQMATMDQLLQQMKLMNQRMNELETKSAAKPVAAATGFLPPPSPTAFLPPTTAPAAMLPLPPPLTVPMIPPAK